MAVFRSVTPCDLVGDSNPEDGGYTSHRNAETDPKSTRRPTPQDHNRDFYHRAKTSRLVLLVNVSIGDKEKGGGSN